MPSYTLTSTPEQAPHTLRAQLGASYPVAVLVAQSYMRARFSALVGAPAAFDRSTRSWTNAVARCRVCRRLGVHYIEREDGSANVDALHLPEDVYQALPLVDRDDGPRPPLAQICSNCYVSRIGGGR